MADDDDTTEANEIVGLSTRHVFLDTQVYKTYGHDLSQAQFNTLGNYIAQDRITLHSTDITLSEIKRQIHDNTRKLAHELKNLAGRYNHWKAKAADILRDDVPDMDADALAESLFRDFRQTLKYRLKAKTHDALAISPEVIFNRYFQRVPPFDSSNAKEFPDAFMVAVLAEWCRKNKTTMYLVTMDKAMQRAAKDSGVLLPLEKLDDLLTTVTAAETPEALARVERIMETIEVQREIEELLSNQLGMIGFTYDGDLSDAEIYEVELAGEFSVYDYSVISVSDESMEVVVDLEVPLSAEVQFEDYSSASYDREDGIYYGVESGEKTVEDRPFIRVYLLIDPSNDNVDDMWVVTNDIRISDPGEDYY